MLQTLGVMIKERGDNSTMYRGPGACSFCTMKWLATYNTLFISQHASGGVGSVTQLFKASWMEIVQWRGHSSDRSGNSSIFFGGSFVLK